MGAIFKTYKKIVKNCEKKKHKSEIEKTILEKQFFIFLRNVREAKKILKRNKRLKQVIYCRYLKNNKSIGNGCQCLVVKRDSITIEHRQGAYGALRNY